jgi:pilus assembly protein CpaC
MRHKPCYLLAICLGLGFLGRVALAQEPLPAPRVEVPVGSTIPLQMAAKQKMTAVRSENPTIATITINLSDPKVAFLKGEKAGFTRVHLTDENKRTEMFEVIVGKTSEQLREEFLSLVRKAEPTAIVDVIPSGGSVIIKGTVATAASIPVIMEIARGLFTGAAIINSMTLGGVQQVELDVVVAIVNRSEARNMGFTFLEGGQQHFFNSTLNTGNIPGQTNLGAAALAANVLTAGANLTNAPSTIFSIMNNKQGFIGFMNALRNENLVKVLAKPSVTTLSGRPAYIVDGGEVPILTSSSAGSNVMYKNFGTVVTFLPVVLGNGRIHLEVQPEISNVDLAIGLSVGGISPASAPGFDTRSARVAVMMEDGQTLAIGGLIQNKVNANTNKVPVLGDLPFFGVAFRSVSYTETEEEMLILVTPRLVDPLACNQIPKDLPGQETRNPDDFELFLEGILEAPRGQRTVSLCDYVPAWRSSPSADMYPCGPGGCGQAHGAPAPAAVPVSNSDPGKQMPGGSGGPQSLPESMPRLVRPVTGQDSDDPRESLEISVPAPMPAGAQGR